MGAVFVNSAVIKRSPEEVFDYLADQRNELQWNPDCVTMEKLTDGPLGVGTRFRAKWKQGPSVTTEITRWDRPRAWTYENGGPISVKLDCTVEPAPGGASRFTARSEWTPNGWFRLLFPVFSRVMRKAESQVMVNASRALEEHRDTTPA